MYCNQPNDLLLKVYSIKDRIVFTKIFERHPANLTLNVVKNRHGFVIRRAVYILDDENMIYTSKILSSVDVFGDLPTQ
jgi:hypothetical protein